MALDPNRARHRRQRAHTFDPSARPPYARSDAPIGCDPDKRNYIVSNQRLREAGFVTKRSLDNGIRELLKGYAMEGLAPYRNAA